MSKFNPRYTVEENLYIKAIKRNETEKFFLGKGKYKLVSEYRFIIHEAWLTSTHIDDFIYYIGFDKGFAQFNKDTTKILERDNITPWELSLLLIYISSVYRNFKDDNFILNEEIKTLINKRIKLFKQKYENQAISNYGMDDHAYQLKQCLLSIKSFELNFNLTI